MGSNSYREEGLFPSTLAFLCIKLLSTPTELSCFIILIPLVQSIKFRNCSCLVGRLAPPSAQVKLSFMDDGLGKIKVLPDHFQASTPTQDLRQNNTASCSHPRTDPSSRSDSRFGARRKFRSAAFMLNLFSFRGLPWSYSSNGQEKVSLTPTEVGSLRSELADLEEREALLKARLEHIDQILRSSRLSCYLYIRTRWTALPGEPPPIDDTDVDDWLPRFAVLQGPCIFFYLSSTDLAPQDSALLSDIVEMGRLPSIIREDGETRHAFYMLTRHGLRYECSSSSKIQVDSWLLALQSDCKLKCDKTVPNG